MDFDLRLPYDECSTLGTAVLFSFNVPDCTLKLTITFTNCARATFYGLSRWFAVWAHLSLAYGGNISTTFPQADNGITTVRTARHDYLDLLVYLKDQAQGYNAAGKSTRTRDLLRAVWQIVRELQNPGDANLVDGFDALLGHLREHVFRSVTGKGQMSSEDAVEEDKWVIEAD